MFRNMTSNAAFAERASAKRLDAVFRPRSVCMIGVSSDPNRLNHAPLKILRMHGFAGEIHLVNPKYHEIDGLRCYKHVIDVPYGIDLALVMVPAQEVPNTLESCADRGMHAAIVLSSGFEEIEGGGDLVQRIRRICADKGLTLIGPNCEGVWSVAAKAILTFGSAARREKLYHAPLAIVSQSGAMSGAIARHLQDQAYGCSYVVSVGNETETNLLEVVDWLLDQPDVEHILLFMEGLRDGWLLGAVAAKARRRGVTLIALKSGNSALGAEAAASHTGKIATPYAIYRDVFAQHGILQVECLTDLVEIAQVLLAMSPVRRNGFAREGGVTICSIPGGTRALTADLCSAVGVPLAKFETKTVEALKQLLPRFGYAHNPTDLTGQILSNPRMLNDALEILAKDPNTEALIVQFANRGLSEVRERWTELASVAIAHRLPIVVSLLSDEMPPDERRRHTANGVFIARDPREAVRWLAWLYQLHAGASHADSHFHSDEVGAAFEVPDETWQSTVVFLDQVGIKTPVWVGLKPGMRAVEACSALKYPVVIKAMPQDIEHKTDLGAVVLNVKDAAALDAAASGIRERIRRPECILLVQEMVCDGVEATLAVMRNADFGSVLAIGAGGIMVELFQDVAYLALPATEGQIDAAIDRLRLSHLLAGLRGAPRADREALVRAAARLGDAFLLLPPSVLEVELNPVFVRAVGEGISAVDVLVKTSVNG
jgi:acetate---CoA ligase (ADP-forming)